METDRSPAVAPRIRGLGFLLGAAVTIFAGVIRFVRLNVPKSLIPLDEFYYPVNALGLLRHGSDFQLAEGAKLPGRCAQIALEPAFAVHPPVGKWLIGAGMRIFGCNSFGWRVAAALVGTATILLVYLIGRRLFRSPWIAALGALLVAVDGLFFVQSRIAMLDVFVAFFIVLAVWLLIEDRARTRPGYSGWRPWRLGSAVAIGLGLATKWSAMFVIPFLIVLGLVWELDRRRRGRAIADEMMAASAGLVPAESGFGWTPREMPLEETGEDPGEDPGETAREPDEPWSEFGSEPEPPAPPPPPWESAPPDSAPGRRFESAWMMILKLGSAFVLLPLLVYVLSYIPWFAGADTRYKPPRCAEQASIEFNGAVSPVNSVIWNWDVWPDQWQEWVCYQREIWDFHKNLKTINDEGKPSHPYLSRAWSWPWMGRPTSHYFNSEGFDDPCEQPPATAAARVRAAQISPTGTETGAGTPSPTPSPTETPAPIDPTRECKTQAEILGLPNPALWFPAFFLAIPYMIWRALGRRDQNAALLLLLFAPLYLPWLITTRPLFLFYMTPAVPILALMVAHMVDRVTEEMRPWQMTLMFALMITIPFTPLYMQWLHAGRISHLLYKIPALAVMFLVGNGLATLLAYTPKPRRLIMVYAGLVLAMFAYFYPVLAAGPIPDGGVFGWRKHMWLQRDCGQQGILLSCWI
ncbi:MAG TPA: phospholipid carrier-dependent glycosyltransferase [Actinomycetota bacterium]